VQGCEALVVLSFDIGAVGDKDPGNIGKVKSEKKRRSHYAYRRF